MIKLCMVSWLVLSEQQCENNENHASKSHEVVLGCGFVTKSDNSLELLFVAER